MSTSSTFSTSFGYVIAVSNSSAVDGSDGCVSSFIDSALLGDTRVGHVAARLVDDARLEPERTGK